MSDKTPDTYIMIDGNTYPAADQPPESEFQGAFKIGGTKKKPAIVVDMAKARIIARDLIRAARAEKFKAVDDLRNKALDDEDAALRKEVKAKAQKLKDAPADPRIDEAKTPADLAAALEAVIADL